MFESLNVNKGWHFKQRSTLANSTAADRFYPVSQFPTVVQLDLLHHGLIPDPYVDDNELQVQWVNDADWTYKTTAIPALNLKPNQRAHFVFDGLDTAVDVYLDNKRILQAKDMHISHRVDVTDHFAANETAGMDLELRFHSARKFARAERDRIGANGKDEGLNFGGNERLFLRKAQYHWGWDWGPVVTTCGPWKDVRLEVFEERIKELSVNHETAPDLKSAKLSISIETESASPGNEVPVWIELAAPDESIVFTRCHSSHDGEPIKFDATVSHPALWYPHQYGDQPLYEVRARVGNQVESRTIGFRRLELVQEPSVAFKGTSFTFRINNIDVFCGGSNLIPLDTMLPRVSRGDYERVVKEAKKGNQTMIRVWGGGTFGDADFYAACDREGILVWQDFLFACGNYPAHDEFVKLVATEARQFLTRSSGSPSLTLLCGNNEDYMLATRWGWDWDPSDETGPWDKTNFPARLLYERTLPHVCATWCPHVPYWRSSPYGGSEIANDQTIGDTHIWDVWHGDMAPYQDYVKYRSRFVSEFGFESPAAIKTLKSAISPQHLQSQSEVFGAHDKGPGYSRRYGMYLSENFRYRMDPFDDYVYCCQMLQAEAMMYAFTQFRRGFQGPGQKDCSGSLVWQLNDVWPCQSWSIMDYHYTPKPAYYAIKRALGPIFVGAERTGAPPIPPVEGGPIVRSYEGVKDQLSVWVTTVSTTPQYCRVSARAFDIETGKELEIQLDRELLLSPNQTTEIATGVRIPDPDTTVVAVYVHPSNRLDETAGPSCSSSCSSSDQGVNTNDGAVPAGGKAAEWVPNTGGARTVSWPEPLKHVQFGHAPQITVNCNYSKGYFGTLTSVTIESSHALKGLTIGDISGITRWQDNYIDVIPNEPYTVLRDPDVPQSSHTSLYSRDSARNLRWLCDWEMTPTVTYTHRTPMLISYVAAP